MKQLTIHEIEFVKKTGFITFCAASPWSRAWAAKSEEDKENCPFEQKSLCPTTW